MTSFKDVLKSMAVFCGLGPLIGLVIFAAGSSLLAVASGTKDGFWIGPFLLIYGVLFAHFVGIAWAALAGVVSVSISFLLKRMPTWIGPVSGLVSFVASLHPKFRMFDGPALVGDGQSPSTFGPAFALVLAATHIGAAWASWVMAKRWVGR
ncbi:MAG TPA: hypothetical protein PK970_04145 [Hyphomicrobiaceae bacterium]|nr:hypothetical protein [Hyphomicrobiaceae bacterium]